MQLNQHAATYKPLQCMTDMMLQTLSDQITLHLFQPHQADQMLTLLTQEGSSFLSTC